MPAESEIDLRISGCRSSKAGVPRGIVRSLADRLHAVHNLSRTEKLRLIQVLAADLAGPDDHAPLASGKTYPLWSPHEAHEAATVLLGVLEAERARS